MFRVKTWQRLNLDSGKVLCFSFAVAAAAGLVVFAATADAMAADSPILCALVSVMVFYLACSLPRRIEASNSLSQSKEAPALAVLGSVALEATHSRAKAVLLLSSGERSVSEVLAGARKAILLGHPPEQAVAGAVNLASGSAAEVLRSVASQGQWSVFEEGEEALAIEKSSQLGEETRSPLFVAAAFFVPLMLLLYAVTARVAEPVSLAGLVVLQVVILDIAFYFSTSDPRRGG